MKNIILKNVSFKKNSECQGGRIGTALISLKDYQAKFGKPSIHYKPGDSDGKVTKVWFYETPRGHVEIRDYYWNAENELSICGNGFEKGFNAGMWFSAWLRLHGVQASVMKELKA